jgi:hypothetical protein
LYQNNLSNTHAAYSIDGLLDDWGINMDNSAMLKGYFDTNLPTGGNDIEHVTEDNADVNRRKTWVGPGYAKRNNYDAEALYFDDDDDYFYVALISGVSPFESKYPAGDLFIDFGQYQGTGVTEDAAKYAFGMSITSGDLYAVNDVINSVISQHSEADPWKFIAEDDLFLGEATAFVYNENEQYSHFVMEAKFEKALFGDIDEDIWLHWTMKCGNDQLNLHADFTPTHTPEPTSLALMATGCLGLFGLRRKQSH